MNLCGFLTSGTSYLAAIESYAGSQSRTAFEECLHGRGWLKTSETSFPARAEDAEALKTRFNRCAQLIISMPGAH